MLAVEHDLTMCRWVAMRARSDRIFARETGFVMLDRQRKRLQADEVDLPAVLDRPEFPLPADGSDCGIRCQNAQRETDS